MAGQRPRLPKLIPRVRSRHPLRLTRKLPSAALLWDVEVDPFDGVVSVAETVPGRVVGLHIAGGVGRAGAHGVPSYVSGVPVEGPVLPLIRPCGRLELRGIPVAFAREADLDAGHRAGAGPGLAPHGVGAGRDV